MSYKQYRSSFHSFNRHRLRLGGKRTRAHRPHRSHTPGQQVALFAALTNAGITTVVVRFDGYGDSGQIESIEARIGEKALDPP